MQEFAKTYYFITGIVLEFYRRGEIPLWVLLIVVGTLILIEVYNIRTDMGRKKRKDK